MAKVLDGKALAKKYHKIIKDRIEELKVKYNQVPGLAVIIVGEDPASQAYVNTKERVAAKLGMYSKQIKLPDSAKEDELLEIVDSLNKDTDIHGVLVQLPLPEHIDENKIIMAIDPKKDVDGFHPVNVGKLLSGLGPSAVSCTPLGIMKIFEEYNIDLKGKNAVVLGRSNIVGKPIAVLMLEKHATVTICHSRTQNIADICKQADIIVVAIGREMFLQKDWVKPGAVVIDVGINRNENTGKIVGDADYDAIEPIADYITPVPGGVGPMTIAMLLNNTLDLFEKSLNRH